MVLYVHALIRLAGRIFLYYICTYESTETPLFPDPPPPVSKDTCPKIPAKDARATRWASMEMDSSSQLRSYHRHHPNCLQKTVVFIARSVLWQSQSESKISRQSISKQATKIRLLSAISCRSDSSTCIVLSLLFYCKPLLC